jgi:cell division control protein 45
MPDGDDDESDEDERDAEEEYDDFVAEDDENEDSEVRSPTSSKRRSLADGNRSPGKRRKLDPDVRSPSLSVAPCSDLAQRPSRISSDQADAYRRQVDRHYSSGYWHAQSTAGTVYILATVLDRADNDLLWCVLPPLHTHTLTWLPQG